MLRSRVECLFSTTLLHGFGSRRVRGGLARRTADRGRYQSGVRAKAGDSHAAGGKGGAVPVEPQWEKGESLVPLYYTRGSVSVSVFLTLSKGGAS